MMLALPLPRPTSSAFASIRDLDRREHTRAVLTGARSVLRRGWLQGGWYVLQSPDGRRRVVGAGSLTPRSYGEVVQACLVGAVVEAASWHSPQRVASAPALDALWCALQELRGFRLDPLDQVPSPAARSARMRDLTRWSDAAGRTQQDVDRLLEAALPEPAVPETALTAPTC
jgi:hypothetical protein